MSEKQWFDLACRGAELVASKRPGGAPIIDWEEAATRLIADFYDALGPGTAQALARILNTSRNIEQQKR